MFRGEDAEPYKLEDFLIQWDVSAEQPEEPDDSVTEPVEATHYTLSAFEQMYAAKKELEA